MERPLLAHVWMVVPPPRPPDRQPRRVAPFRRNVQFLEKGFKNFNGFNETFGRDRFLGGRDQLLETGGALGLVARPKNSGGGALLGRRTAAAAAARLRLDGGVFLVFLPPPQRTFSAQNILLEEDRRL